MQSNPPADASTARDKQRPPCPRHKIAAAIDPDRVEELHAALATAGMDGDRVDVVTADDDIAPDEPVGGPGLPGFFARLGLRLGGDLDAMTQARFELSQGHVLVLVAVNNDAERDQVREILRDHGGHSMRYFGHWTIITLDGGAH